MKKFRILPLVLALCLALTIFTPAAFALDDPDLNAQSALLVDLDSGRVLYAKNADERRAPASLTKVMTVMLVLEAVNQGEIGLDDPVTAQDDCRDGMSDDSSTAGIVPGVTTTVRELLYCALLKSANEACNVLGRYTAGSVSAFVERMNAKAQELGCSDTHFANTNGLTAEDHYTTARDLYKITVAAMNYPLFMEICNTQGYQPSTNAINGGEIMYNSNALISSYSDYGYQYLYEYASGIKTGYTRAAGYCLISTAERQGIRVLGIVLGCDGWYNAQIEDLYNFIDSKNLYEWCWANFGYNTVLTSADPIGSVHVDMAEGDGMVPVYPQHDVILLVPNDLSTDRVETETMVYPEMLRAPLEAGTVVGEAHVKIDGVDYGAIRLVNNSPVELARTQYMLQRLRAFFSNGWVIVILIVILVLAAAYIALVVYYRRLRRRHLRERKEAEARRRQEEAERRIAAEFRSSDGSDEWKDLF